VVKFIARGHEVLISGTAPRNSCKLQARHRDILLNLVEWDPVLVDHRVMRAAEGSGAVVLGRVPVGF
jgi:hypothetical protein